RRARAAIRRLLRQERPDIIHSNDLQTHQIVADAARGLGVPRLCHHRFSFDGRAIDWLNKFGAEHHVFIARALREEMFALSPRLAAAPWSQVYDGIPVPPEPAAGDRVQARRALGLPAEKAVVLFVGQVIECKGVADLLRAWSLLAPPCRVQAELVLVGEDCQN